ncbi:MAG: hypothetical protein HOF29_13190 [Candidatus Marinimicrobia bacterium]|jgi:metal-responsive CopG/Arc/MetJ family transcriptional regulator|nr:hypothetical protein [Candidatus Neomarinimicrobiota bacterium]MBT7209083.1 hypothetical protein [Gammaproteobacteria bacterium]MBT4852417.1 hypothetical protein [Candidatus Neomarinimicrobiota bacterium]MBT5212903.1 hypothetical protein [Candidatus Neomarinimicrobiota bacterium]MBT5539905.1 hypothetical protein [Candidatus Neomarinimicrobiota bacterium]
MEKHARLNITLPQYLAEELADVSIEMKNKKSRIIAKALELYFDELDVRIAENRLDEIGDDESTVPASEVWEKLGL